jgi:hypothetical protein
LPEIRFGLDRFTLSRFADDATDRLIFTLTAEEFEALTNGSNVMLRIGGAAPWSFGALSK